MARSATQRLSFKVEVLSGDYARTAADVIHVHLPVEGAVVITGGTTARAIYGHLDPTRFDALTVGFSDERCVPPDDDASNYRMANEAFLARSDAKVLRMPGELPPDEGARNYHAAIAPFATGIELMLLGMGADCHVGALFPDSPALGSDLYCAAVDRPDGLRGLTLTPPVMRGARKILLLVSGQSKADAVRRAVTGNEPPIECPARLLAEHADASFLLDDAAASSL